jgi:heterodisulfide reductase subunit B
MRYTFYPGCSLDATAKEFQISTRAMAGKVGLELAELEDWICWLMPYRRRICAPPKASLSQWPAPRATAG